MDKALGDLKHLLDLLANSTYQGQRLLSLWFLRQLWRDQIESYNFRRARAGGRGPIEKARYYTGASAWIRRRCEKNRRVEGWLR